MNTVPDDFSTIVARLLGRKDFRLQALRPGGNAQVFLVRMVEDVVVAKRYFRHAGDPRDRLETEWLALSFLARHEVSLVPRPLARDSDLGIALYSYLAGRPADSVPAAAGMLDQAIAFLESLHRLRRAPDAAALPQASEACLSFAMAETALRQRLKRLRRLPQQDQLDLKLRAFLDQDFIPTCEELLAACRLAAARRDIPWDKTLQVSNRTVSPSDFGFHNAVIADDGRMFFVDFEYFGWDDPAKMCADFLLHPAMNLARPLCDRFGVAVHRIFASPSFAASLAIHYPLQGLKWCLLLANEFIPAERSRRRFAAIAPTDADFRQKQLAKAASLLARLRREPFPSFLFPSGVKSHG